jgi:arylsulfatase A-like enzyme/tetratricopeptide (TPR) repeat protein
MDSRLAFASMCLCGGALGACFEQEPPAPAPPSVLLITLDTTRADRLGPYGYVNADTPAYDQLAAQGTVFTRAYSSCPLTIPSHSTILTGRAPPSHGVRDNGDFVLGEDAVTLAERFKDAGYTTFATTAAFPTQARWGFDQGFDTYHDPLKRLPTQLDWRDERTAGEVVDDALAVLESTDGPVFAWVHLFDAHWPYAPPEPFASQHPGRPYDGEIAYAAAQVERLLEAWDAKAPRNVVLVTADHGEGMGDGGEMTHGFLLHDGTIRVPMLLRAQGLGDAVAVGETVDDPVGHVDIAPTLLRLAGLPLDDLLQGKDLREGGSDRVYSEALTGQFNLGLAPLFAWTDGSGRYTEGSWGGFYPAVGARVLTGPDPIEDLSEQAAALALLRAGLDEVIAPGVALDAESLQQLQALGYIGGDPTAEAGSVDPRDVIDVIPLTWKVRQVMGAGRFDLAESTMSQLEDRMPGTWGVELLRAQLLRAQGRPMEALQRFVDLYQRAPGSTVALQVAAIHVSRGEWFDAEGWFREALELQPASPEAMGGIVRSMLAQGEVEEARAAADRYLLQYPDHAELILTRAELLLADGRAADALVDAEAALDQMAWSPMAWALVGRCRWALGDADTALDALQEALRLDPFHLPVRAAYTERLLEVGRNAEAVRAVAPVARLFPDDPVVAALHARALAALQSERDGTWVAPPPLADDGI